MTLEEQTVCFSKELSLLTNKYADEFDLTYEAMVGAIEMHKLWLVYGFYENFDNEEEEDGGDLEG